ncbi:MAG: hypothetical protein ACLSGI_07890 [Butyricicoccaceae bacterium]
MCSGAAVHPVHRGRPCRRDWRFWPRRPNTAKLACTDLCISVALGEPFSDETEPCDTLYLALEDSEQRLQARGQTVLGDRLPPENCYIGTLAGSLADRLPHQRSLSAPVAGHRPDRYRHLPEGACQRTRRLQPVRQGLQRYGHSQKHCGRAISVFCSYTICARRLSRATRLPAFWAIQGINGASDTNFVMVREERSDDITHFTAQAAMLSPRIWSCS